MIKKNAGISLIALIITIIVIIILSAIVISVGTNGIDSTKSAKIASEKKALETAIIVRFGDYALNDEIELFGKEITVSDLSEFDDANEEDIEFMRKVGTYEIQRLGIKNPTGATYIVDYYNGDVFGPIEE